MSRRKNYYWEPAEYVCSWCCDCSGWDDNGGCRAGVEWDELPDSGDCWEFEPWGLWEDDRG